jgi:hypothetical protein
MLGIEVDGYSQEEVYEKMEWKTEMNELGLLFWDSSDEQILKDMGNVIRTIEFYIWEMKTHPSPSQEGVRSIRKKSWFNFQNYWYEDDSKFRQNTNSKKNRTEFPSGEKVQIICF